MKKHLYESVTLLGIAFSACGRPVVDVDVVEKEWQQYFAKSKRHVTCKNCKRTKLFRGVK